MEWRWGGSWWWQLEWQLGPGRGAGLEDSWGGAAVGLAGSRWPRVTLEGGLGEALQESRASWRRHRPSQARESAWVVLRCSLEPPQSTRRTQGDVQGAGPAAKPKHPQARPALCFAPSLSGFHQGLGEGRGKFWAVPWEGAGLPGLLPWGWWSNTTGWRINRQVLRLVTAVKTAQKTQLGEDRAVVVGCCLGGRW